MAIYNIIGESVSAAYDTAGKGADVAHDIDGNVVYQSRNPMDDYIDGRVLTFEDDFDGNALDETKWIYELGDLKKNNELQAYRRQNISVKNSCLVITAKREDFLTQHWTSGSITTESKFTQVYGRWEAKIKFPNISGAFCAFWMKGANQINHYDEYSGRTVEGVEWPMCGEIDITETIPGNATRAQANLWKYSGGSFGAGRSGNIDSSQWHLYAVEWTDADIKVFVDGTIYKSWTYASYAASETQAYHLPFFMIVNMAVGASGGTPPSDISEMKMYVDWVRVYAPLS